MSADSASCSPTICKVTPITAKSPLAQAACWRPLMAAKSGGVAVCTGGADGVDCIDLSMVACSVFDIEDQPVSCASAPPSCSCVAFVCPRILTHADRYPVRCAALGTLAWRRLLPD